MKLLTFLVLLCVLKVHSDSVWVEGEGWVDYDFGEEHTISAASSPLNVSLSQSAVVMEFFVKELDHFHFDTGDLRDFAILCNTQVTNDGNTTVMGSFGSMSSNSSLAEGISVTGTIEDSSSTVSENALAMAQSLLSQAQNSSFQCDITYHESLDNNLGGQILNTGVNCWTFDDVYITDGDLILDADGLDAAFFVIRINGGLTVGSWGNSVRVRLMNGGSPCNIYWFVGGDVIIHEDSLFLGTLISGGNIVLGEDASVIGQIISTTGSVSLYDNSIDNSGCANSTRRDFNTTFAIYPAITVPIGLGDHDQLVVLNDQSNGFEIVTSGSISYVDFFIPQLNSTQAQLVTGDNATFTFQVWFISSVRSICSQTTSIQKFTEVQTLSDGSFFLHSNFIAGTFFFVLVYNEEQHGSSSSTGAASSSSGGTGGTGGTGGGGSSSGGYFSSTGFTAPTLLTDGVSQSGSVSHLRWDYYYFVTTTDIAWTVTLTVSSGDADLYITSSNGKAWVSENSGTVTDRINGYGAAGSYYISVFGYSASQYTIVYTTST